MITDLVGYSKDVIVDGRRLEIFFQRNGIAEQYIKNISVIGEKDDKTARHYKEWLLQSEVPKIRDRILEAIENDFLNGTLDKDCYLCKCSLHEELFNMFENMIKREITERDFLKAYV